MNSQFNYATFVEMFLKSDEEHEPYGVSQPAPLPAREPVVTEYLLSPPA